MMTLRHINDMVNRCICPLTLAIPVGADAIVMSKFKPRYPVNATAIQRRNADAAAALRRTNVYSRADLVNHFVGSNRDPRTNLPLDAEELNPASFKDFSLEITMQFLAIREAINDADERGASLLQVVPPITLLELTDIRNNIADYLNTRDQAQLNLAIQFLEALRRNPQGPITVAGRTIHQDVCKIFAFHGVHARQIEGLIIPGNMYVAPVIGAANELAIRGEGARQVAIAAENAALRAEQDAALAETVRDRAVLRAPLDAEIKQQADIAQAQALIARQSAVASRAAAVVARAAANAVAAAVLANNAVVVNQQQAIARNERNIAITQANLARAAREAAVKASSEALQKSDPRLLMAAMKRTLNGVKHHTESARQYAEMCQGISNHFNGRAVAVVQAKETGRLALVAHGHHATASKTINVVQASIQSASQALTAYEQMVTANPLLVNTPTPQLLQHIRTIFQAHQAVAQPLKTAADAHVKAKAAHSAAKAAQLVGDDVLNKGNVQTAIAKAQPEAKKAAEAARVQLVFTKPAVEEDDSGTLHERNLRAMRKTRHGAN